ncbi:MAG: hypothetical protein J7J31_09250 [Helicobacteraceae bacterium]|nr:hypothetical protein [Helicobacteraceae bacterium]
MIKTLFFTLLTTLVYATNPAVYSALGDVIFNNAPHIDNLKNIKEYERYKMRIEEYVAKVAQVKEEGFRLERGDTSVDKKAYLQKLRELSNTNDFFVKDVHANYKASMRDKDNELFSKMINSKLLDVNKYKSEIKEYYIQNSEGITQEGVIQKLLDEDARLAKQRELTKKKYKSKEEIEREKIERLRKKDKEQAETLQKSLEKELQEKKKKILKEQVQELSR